MPLVYTTTEGADPNIVELLTVNQGVERPLVQGLSSDIVANESTVPGATVTAALDSLAGGAPAPLVSQIGWASNVNSDVLELVPAGHAPGQYEVSLTLVVRTSVAANASVTLTWASPTFGAESKQPGNGMQLSSTGTSVLITGTQSVPLRCLALVSTGATPITLQMTSTGVAGGVTDIYASARLIAV